MAVLKKHLSAPHGSKGKVVKHEGKGATEQKLPSRHAMETLTRGDPSRRTMNDYAKATPMPEQPSVMPSGPGIDDDAYLGVG